MVETTAMYDVGGKTDLCTRCNADCNENTRRANHPRRTVSPPVARKPREMKVALKVRLKLRALCV